MKSQLKKLKGTSVKLAKTEIYLKDYFRLEDSQFDQIYYTLNIAECTAKIYDLESDLSLPRFKNQTQNYEQNRLHSLPTCVAAQQFKNKKKDYGVLVLRGVFNGNSLQDKNLKLSDQQLLSLSLFLVRSVNQLRKKKFSYCNIRPENIYSSPQNSFFLINPQFLIKINNKSEISQFFYELVQKDHTYWAPEVLDNYSTDPINYASDLFSVGCLLYTIKYGKYPFESRLATINFALNLPEDDSMIGMLISRFLGSYKDRMQINLDEIQTKLQELVYEEQRKIKQQKFEDSLKKGNGNGNSFFTGLSNAISKMKNDFEGLFLNYVEDDEKQPQEKYLDNILSKIYKKEQKMVRLNQIIEKFLQSNGDRDNPILKTLLLIGNILRKGPNHVYKSFDTIISTIVLKFHAIPSIKEFGVVLQEKAKINEKLKKCLCGNYYLSQMTSFKELSVGDVKEMVVYLQKVVNFLKKKITDAQSDLNDALITFLCDEIYSLISMVIFSIIGIRKDNDLQLRNDSIKDLMPIEKMVNSNLRKISDISNFVAAHAIYSLQSDFVFYQEQIALSQNPYYTSLEHFYRSCRYYKGLSIPEDYNKIYLKQQKVEKTEKKISLEKKSSKNSQKPKVYFDNYFVDSDEEFDFKHPKKSQEAPTSTKVFEDFGGLNGGLKSKKSQKSGVSQTFIDKKTKKKGFNDKDSDNNSRGSKNEQKKSTISFEQFGKLTKEETKKKSELSTQFNFFNEINKKPNSSLVNDIKERKNCPPKPPKPNNNSSSAFEDFNNIFLKQNKQQKNKEKVKQVKINEKVNMLFQQENPFTNDIWSLGVQKNEKLEEIMKGLKLKELKDLLEKNQKLVIDFKELVFEKVIGSGSAGDVFLGKYKGQKIAIKKVKVKENPNALKEFQRELVTYIKIKKNPHLVSLIGLSADNGDFYLLTQFCESGSLFDLLHKRAKQIYLSWDEKIQFAIQIAEGMKCLHEMRPTIIHRDLKSLNVFVTKAKEKWKMKVADFGLSRSPQAEMMTTQLGTIHWMAPQLLEGKQYSIKVDVYSYGILLWEILARKTPYSNLNSPMAILKYVAIDKQRPSLDLIDKECPRSLIGVMEKCWAHQSAKRPDFRSIICELKEMKQNVLI